MICRKLFMGALAEKEGDLSCVTGQRQVDLEIGVKLTIRFVENCLCTEFFWI